MPEGRTSGPPRQRNGDRPHRSSSGCTRHHDADVDPCHTPGSRSGGSTRAEKQSSKAEQRGSSSAPRSSRPSASRRRAVRRSRRSPRRRWRSDSSVGSVAPRRCSSRATCATASRSSRTAIGSSSVCCGRHGAATGSHSWTSQRCRSTARSRLSCGSRRARAHFFMRRSDKPGSTNRVQAGQASGSPSSRSRPGPFFAPVFDKYAQPEQIARRFLEPVATLLGGDFGRP
jgi:hypothetical protein